MALDSRNKRGSAIGINPASPVLPNPDGSIAVSDRAQVAHAYSGLFASATAAGSIFPDLEVDVVKLTLTVRAGGTATYYFGLDYWEAGTLYSGSPEILPLLKELPLIQNGAGGVIGIQNDTTIQLYGKADFDRKGRGLYDLRSTHEFHESTMECRYYVKPRGALATHSDSVNIRETYRVIDLDYDETSGALSLVGRQVWFRDSELSKKTTAATFPDQDAKYDGEYGGMVFGQAATVSDGVLLDAPFIESGVDEFQRPYGKIFSGWTFPGHPNKAFQRLMVKNQHRNTDPTEWLKVALASNPQNPYLGDISTGTGTSSTIGRSLAWYSRAIVHRPTTDARILTAVRARALVNSTYLCPDFAGSTSFYNVSPGILSPGDVDFSVAGWVYVDNASERAVLGKGDKGLGTLEWWVRVNSAGKLAFGVSSTGTAYDVEAVYGTALSTGQWYFFVGWHDAFANTVNIQVNETATVSASTIARSNTCAGGDRDYATLDAGASGTDDAFNTYFITITSGTGMGQTRQIIDYDGTLKRAFVERQFSPAPDATSGYAITIIASKKQGAFQIGYMNGAAAHLDGRAQMIGFWNGVLGSSQKTALYNSFLGLAYRDLTDSEKANLVSWWNLDEFEGKRLDSHGNNDLTESIATGIALGKVLTGGLSSDDGELRCNVFEAVYSDEDDTYVPVGGAVRSSTLEFPNSISNGYFQIDPPLVMSPNVDYMVTLEWTNISDVNRSVFCDYRSHAGSVSYARKNTATDKGWVKQQDVELSMELYVLGDGDDAFKDGTTSGIDRYSYYHLEAKQITLIGDQQHKEFNKELQFKIGVSGIKDDASGTYTGIANAVIENPSDMIRFLLMHSSTIGLSSSQVDTASFASVRSSLAAAGLLQKFVVRSETTYLGLITEICRQARIVFLRKRDGKLALYYPTPFSAPDFTFSEPVLRGEMQLINVADNDYETVVNDFLQFYKPDELNQPTDPAFLRRTDADKFIGRLVMNGTASTSADSYRQGLCATSQARYGKRPHTAKLDFYDSAAPAQKVQNYYADRYTDLAKRCAFRIPRRRFYDSGLALFSAVRVSHTGIFDVSGTAQMTKAHTDGYPAVVYDEGIPCLTWSGGTIEGRVVDVGEQGPFLTVVVETLSSF